HRSPHPQRRARPVDQDTGCGPVLSDDESHCVERDRNRIRRARRRRCEFGLRISDRQRRGGAMTKLWWAQIKAVIRLEMKKTCFARRGLWIYILALLPLLLFTAHTVFTSRDREK